MKILLTPLGSAGDVRPLASYGIHLREVGHEVLVYGTAEWEGLCARHALPFRRSGADFMAAAAHTIALVGRPLASLAQGMADARRMTQAQAIALQEVVGRHDRVVGSGLQAAAVAAAHSCRAPYLHLLHTPTCVRSSYHTPPIFPFSTAMRPLNALLWHVFGVCLRQTFGSVVRPAAPKPRPATVA